MVRICWLKLFIFEVRQGPDQRQTARPIRLKRVSDKGRAFNLFQLQTALQRRLLFFVFVKVVRIPNILDLGHIRSLLFVKRIPVNVCEEWVCFNFLDSFCSKPVLRIRNELAKFRQWILNEISSLDADWYAFRYYEVLSPVSNFIPRFVWVWRIKWRIAHQHFKKYDAHGPPIYNLSITASVRGNVLLPWTSGAT